MAKTKTAQPKGTSTPRVKGETTKPASTASRKAVNTAEIEVKAGDAVKLYNVPKNKQNKAIEGRVVLVHGGLRIDVVAFLSGGNESFPTVQHISKSGSPSDFFWDN